MRRAPKELKTEWTSDSEEESGIEHAFIRVNENQVGVVSLPRIICSLHERYHRRHSQRVASLLLIYRIGLAAMWSSFVSPPVYVDRRRA